MIRIWLPMEPPTCTAQQARIGVLRKTGKVWTYHTDALRDARQKYIAHLAGAAPEIPLAGPLRLVVKWCFSAGDSHRDGQYKPTKPDTDNMIKLLKDCMTECRFWKDDAQVASEINEKFWSTKPGIYIEVQQLDPQVTE